MDVTFVKHDLRNISTFGEDGIGADRPDLQRKIHFENHAFYTHCSTGLSALILSSTKAEIFLRSCLTKSTSMVGSIGGSLGSQN